MSTTLLIVLAVVAAAAAYFFLVAKGKIKDTDQDLIPDAIEDKVAEAKGKVASVKNEVKSRAKNVKAEIKDVKDAAKEAYQLMQAEKTILTNTIKELRNELVLLKELKK